MSRLNERETTQQRSLRPTRRAVLAGLAAGSTMLSAPLIARAASKELRFLNNEPEPRTLAYLKTKLVPEYEAATSVRIVVETIPSDQTWNKVTTAIKTGRPYDVMTIGDATQAALLAAEGYVSPVTDLIKSVGVDDFGPRSRTIYKGDDVWMPYDYNFCFLYIRTDWLAEKKLSLPSNWDEFLAVCRAFTDADKRRYGFAGPISPTTTTWANSGFLWSSGTAFYDDKFNVVLDSPEIKPKVVQALDLIASIYPYQPPGVFSMKLGDVLNSFYSGTSGIAPYTGRMVHNIEDKAPDIADKYTIMPYPEPKPGPGYVTFGGDGFVIGKSDRTEEAQKFLQWFMQNGKMTEWQLTLPLHYQPPQYSTYRNATWLAHPMVKKYSHIVDELKSFMDTKKTVIDAVELQGPYLTANQGRITNNEIITNMYQNVITKKMTSSQAVDAAAMQVRGFTEKV